MQFSTQEIRVWFWGFCSGKSQFRLKHIRMKRDRDPHVVRQKASLSQTASGCSAPEKPAKFVGILGSGCLSHEVYCELSNPHKIRKKVGESWNSGRPSHPHPHQSQHFWFPKQQHLCPEGMLHFLAMSLSWLGIFQICFSFFPFCCLTASDVGHFPTLWWKQHFRKKKKNVLDKFRLQHPTDPSAGWAHRACTPLWCGF